MTDAVDDFLEHFGVKGMRWGVVKDKDSTTSDFSMLNVKNLQRSKKQLSRQERARSVATNEVANLQKAGSDSKGFPFSKKQVAIGVGVVAGAAALGYLGYRAYVGQPVLPGKSISLAKFNELAYRSKMNSWDGGFAGTKYLKQSSFDRPAFTVPKGSVFHRITIATNPSDIFHSNAGTYATANTKDYVRYLNEYVNEKMTGSPRNFSFNHATFTSNDEIRVPNLKDTLGVFQNAMRSSGIANVTSDKVLTAYQERIGGSWDDSLSKTFFQKLKESGYNAFVDDKDEGVISDSPLILLSKELFGNFKIEKITDSIMEEAESQLVELLRRKM